MAFRAARIVRGRSAPSNVLRGYSGAAHQGHAAPAAVPAVVVVVPTVVGVVQLLDVPTLLGVTAVDVGELIELGCVDVYPGLVGRPGVDDV